MFSTFTTCLNSASSDPDHYHHHHHHLLSSGFLHHQDPGQQLDHQVVQLQPVCPYTDQQTLIDMVISRNRALRSLPIVGRPIKKDRHSKIHTAQGLRDRRVRLSIGIARRFFDLQDMLGFDKASKTLEWLLGNSNNAIKKLAMNNHIYDNQGNNPHDTTVTITSTATLSSSSSSDCTGVNASEEDNGRKMETAGTDLDLARESRAKARARARERTRDKLNQSRTSSSQTDANHNGKDLVAVGQQTMETKKKPADNQTKLTSGSISGHHQQSAGVSREGNYFNNLDYFFPNLPPNWDISSALINVYSCTESEGYGKV